MTNKMTKKEHPDNSHKVKIIIIILISLVNEYDQSQSAPMSDGHTSFWETGWNGVVWKCLREQEKSWWSQPNHQGKLSKDQSGEISVINTGKERNTLSFHLGVQQSERSLDEVLRTCNSKTSQHAWSPVHTWHSVLTEPFHPGSYNLHK